jgi:hypothetical protein
MRLELKAEIAAQRRAALTEQAPRAKRGAYSIV